MKEEETPSLAAVGVAVGAVAALLWVVSKVFGGSDPGGKTMKAPGKSFRIPRKDFDSDPAGLHRKSSVRQRMMNGDCGCCLFWSKLSIVLHLSSSSFPIVTDFFGNMDPKTSEEVSKLKGTWNISDRGLLEKGVESVNNKDMIFRANKIDLKSLDLQLETMRKKHSVCSEFI